MERQEKPWSELTEEERQVVRESWKHTLPEKFDVFCIGDLHLTVPIIIPGNLYVSHDVFELTGYGGMNIQVHENFIVDGNVDAGFVSVAGNFIIGGCIESCNDISVIGNFISDNAVSASDVIVGGNFTVDGIVDACALYVNKIFDCHDVRSIVHKIYATDYVCRNYKKYI